MFGQARSTDGFLKIVMDPGVTSVTIEDGLTRLDALDFTPHPLGGYIERISRVSVYNTVLSPTPDIP